jgi:pentatricopeptide repeat protein
LGTPVWSERQRCLQDAASILSDYHRKKVLDADSLSLVFDLLERVIKELANTDDKQPFLWLCQDRFHHTFIIQWKQAAVQQKLPVLSPIKLAQKMIRMSQMLPEHFQLGIYSISILLDVAAKTSTVPAEAPSRMEQLLSMFFEQMPYHPTGNLVIYNQLLSAWARSGADDAPQKMEHVLEIMQNQGLQPNHVTFNTQLRYWGGLGDLQRVESLWEEMQQHRLEPDAISLSEAISAYAKAGKPDKATELLEQLVQNHPLLDKKMHDLVAARMQNILLSCRDMIKYRAHRKIIRKAVLSAEKVYNHIRTLVHMQDNQNLHVTMMDIYARAKMRKQCQAIFDAVPRTVNTYTVLMKLYGNLDRADKATLLLQEMLQDASITPNLIPFSTVLGAWVCTRR